MRATSEDGGRAYIEGVRRISWSTGEMCEFASALVAAAECLGEDASYDYVMGASGAAFRFAIRPGAWDPGNYGIRNFTADPDEPILRAFRAIGRSCTIHPRGSEPDDADCIMASIENGTPVLAFGVVGPSDCCIITGYDGHGEVLLGWSTYQDIPDDHDVPHDRTGYFRKPGWHDNLGGYVVIGAGTGPISLREVFLDSLRWAVRLARTPNAGERSTGLEGLRVWAREMADEKQFPADDASTIAGRYLGAAVNMMMLTDLQSAAPFLRQAAQEAPVSAEALMTAASHYDDACRLRQRLDDLIPYDFSDKAMRGIADAATRRAFADCLLEVHDEEDKAVAYIERALRY